MRTLRLDGPLSLSSPLRESGKLGHYYPVGGFDAPHLRDALVDMGVSVPVGTLLIPTSASVEGIPLTKPSWLHTARTRTHFYCSNFLDSTPHPHARLISLAQPLTTPHTHIEFAKAGWTNKVVVEFPYVLQGVGVSLDVITCRDTSIVDDPNDPNVPHHVLLHTIPSEPAIVNDQVVWAGQYVIQIPYLFMTYEEGDEEGVNHYHDNMEVIFDYEFSSWYDYTPFVAKLNQLRAALGSATVSIVAHSGEALEQVIAQEATYSNHLPVVYEGDIILYDPSDGTGLQMVSPLGDVTLITSLAQWNAFIADV